MDLFEYWLGMSEKSKWVKRALIDKSYKKEYQRINCTTFNEKVNSDLATYGDGVLRLGFLDLLLDKTEYLSEEKAKYESDKFLIEVVAKHYNMLNYIKKDTKNKKMINEYVCLKKHNSNNYHYKTKYIATAVEAMIGAIFKETNNIKVIVKILKTWIELDNSDK